MPSTSKKQHNFMAAVAKNPKFAKKVGIPRSVGEEFLTADKGKKFKEGGIMTRYVPGFKGPMTPAASPRTASASGTRTAPAAGVGMTRASGTRTAPAAGVGMKKGGTAHSDVKMDKKVIKKAVGMHEKQLHGGKKSDMSKLKSGGMACAPKKMARGGGIEMKGKTKGTMVKMKKGGAC
jgi:hypothetical protein